MARVREVGPTGQQEVTTCQEVVDVTGSVDDAVEDVLRKGARQLLVDAIEAEVAE